MVDDDRVKGAVQQKGGELKEKVGKALGDEKMKREGQGDQVAGKARNIVGSVKEKLHERDDDKV